MGFGAVGLTSAPSLCAPRRGLGGHAPDGDLTDHHVRGAAPEPSIRLLRSTRYAPRSRTARAFGRARSQWRDPRVAGGDLAGAGDRGTLSALFVRRGERGLGQISFDGVPLYELGTPALLTSLAIPADALESVDVVRGASRPRYGSRAFGGVIRLDEPRWSRTRRVPAPRGRELRHALGDGRRGAGGEGAGDRDRESRRCLRWTSVRPTR